MSAQQEWLNHRVKFLADNGVNWPTPKSYFEAHGLNVNSGRREFTKITKLEKEGHTHDEIALMFAKPFKVKKPPSQRSKAPKTAKPKADQKSSDQKKSDQRKGDQKKGDQKKSDHSAKAKKTSNSKGSERGQGGELITRDKVIKKKLKRLTTPLQDEFVDESSDAQIGNGGKFQRGNAAAFSGGAYMDAMKIPEKFKNMVAANSGIDGLEGIFSLEEARYLMLFDNVTRQRERICNEFESGRVVLDHENKQVPLDELEGKVLFGSSSSLGALFGGFVHAKIQAAKAAAEIDIKYYKLDKEVYEGERRKELIALRGEDDEALPIVRQFEREGLTPPPLLLMEASQEIKLMAPKIDMSGISDAELDKVVAEYEAKNIENLDVFKSRARSIEMLLLEAKAESELGGLDEEDFEDDYTGFDHLSDEAINGNDETDLDDEWDE